MGQMRLPWPRVQQEVTCGHPEKRHYSGGMCLACYHREYRRQQKEYAASKEGVRLAAPAELTCYNRDSNGVCLGHPYKPGPVYHDG